MRLLVTGGCGFVGSHFIRYVLQHYVPEMITNVDSLATGHLINLGGAAEEFRERYEFLCADLGEEEKIEAVLSTHQYFAVVHFAADACGAEGTEALLRRARNHGVRRFLLVSKIDASANVAAVEARALSAFEEHGQEVVITRAAETYGPAQSLSGLIPNLIRHGLRETPLPLSGDGSQTRDWLHVEDHCAALFAALLDGQPGATYRVAPGLAVADRDLAARILEQLGRARDLVELHAAEPAAPRGENARVADQVEPLAWKPRHGFDAGLRTTIDWYVRHRAWLESLDNP